MASTTTKRGAAAEPEAGLQEDPYLGNVRGRVYTPVSLPRNLAEALAVEAKRLGIGRSELIAAALVAFLAIVAQGRTGSELVKGASPP